MLEQLVNWLVAGMLAWAPASTHAFTGETPGQVENRYEGIATSIATVVLDEHEAPLFEGAQGRAKTALLMTAIASFETGGFSKKVDTDEGTGDGLTAHCNMQVHQSVHGALDCYRKSLTWLRSSFKDCARLPLLQRMSEYASGSCTLGHGASEKRMKRAMKRWEEAPFATPLVGPRESL
jgi:hypothetical protein